MTTVLAIDGNSVAHRAFHALDEEEHGDLAVLDAVVRMVAGIWGLGPYAGLLIGFDHPVNHRKQADPAYKAGRSEKHPALVSALDALPGLLERIGWTVARVEGAEADDVMASAAADAADLDVDLHVLSSDRDLLALVSERVTVLRPRHGMHDLIVTDPATVREEFGVEPRAYTAFSALRGDPSDGLKGVHGVGRRTAARLLRDHPTIADLYANLHHVDPAVEARLRRGRDLVERNLALMTPMPVPSRLADAVTVGTPADAWRAALVDHDLPRAGRMLHAAITRPPPPPAPLPRDEVVRVAPPAPSRDLPAAAASGEQDSLF